MIENIIYIFIGTLVSYLALRFSNSDLKEQRDILKYKVDRLERMEEINKKFNTGKDDIHLSMIERLGREIKEKIAKLEATNLILDRRNAVIRELEKENAELADELKLIKSPIIIQKRKLRLSKPDVI